MDATIRRLLTAIGEPLVDVLVAPAGLDVAVTGIAIVDPEDEPGVHAGRLVHVIGSRGRSAERAVRAVASGGAVAVAVKTGPGPARELRAACTDAGVALLAVRDDARWDHVEQLARSVVEEDGG